MPDRAPLSRFGRPTSFSANLVSNYAGRGWEALMSVAFIPLYIRYLGPEAYGIIGLLAVIQSFMLILDFGMTPALTREAARYRSGERNLAFLRDLVRSVELAVGGLGALIVLALALAAPAIATQWIRAQELPINTITTALTIGGGLIAMRFFESIFRGTLFGLERQALCNGIGAASATIRGGGAALLVALTDWGLPGFFAWQAAASLLTVVAMRGAVALALPAVGRPARFSPAALRSVGRFALGMLAISILALIATQLDKVLLSRLLPLDEFGTYMFAANVALALELASAPIMTTVYPRVVDLMARGDSQGLAKFFHRWARVVTLLTAPAAALLAFFASDVIRAWSGDAGLAADTGPLLAVLAVGTFIHGQCVLPYQVQLAAGWTSLAIWTNVAAIAATAVALPIFVPLHGALAAAWCWVGVASLYFAATTVIFFRLHLIGERSRFLLNDVALPVTAAFGTMALCRAAFPAAPDNFAGQMLMLGAAGALSFAATTGAVFAVDRLRAPREAAPAP